MASSSSTTESPTTKGITMARFDNKIAVVVGAAQGIGKVTAELFAREGATVVTTDVSPNVDVAFKDIRDRVPGLVGFSTLHDVTDPDSSAELVGRVVEEYGRIDILAHVAGVVQTAGLAETLDIAEWDRVMNVNLKGPFLTTRAVIPTMRANNWGRIVIIGSYYGRHGVAYFTAYNASKAGVINYAASLALEVADANITVNSVSPGMVNTGMHQGALQAEADKRGITYEEMRDTEWNKTPFKKAGDPEDIANAVLFLASNEAKYITGASLDVNGGVLTR
jgi:NAD(P)-dependent dehydrogenase (short-subunit alcohol dehydrogenase family)